MNDFSASANDISSRSLAELSQCLSTGEATSREIVAACLDRIAALDGRLHAFIDVYREDALAAAQAADLERRDGMARGPLHGLPIALKDLLHFDGRQTTAGSKSWLGRRSTVTAAVIERLLAAGMIPLGKTHLVEFAFGGFGRNEPMGAPWNPWDLSIHRVAGGSSSGSAVAVAAGLSPAAIGTDTGGSVRIPAAACGLTGHKTTYGLVSVHGVVPLAATLDSIGPLTHSAEDAALLVAAMAGPDPRDPATMHAPRFDRDAALAADLDLRGTRITALAVEQFPIAVDDAVLRARTEVIAVLRARGAQVEEQRIPIDLDDVMTRNGRIIAAEAYAVHRAYIEDTALPIDPWVRKRTFGGKAIGAADYIDELAHRRAVEAQFHAWMAGRDALLTPTLPFGAPVLADVDESATPLAAFTRAANYLGACALSLPAGLTDHGLPVAIQLVGARFTDASLLRLGRALQRDTRWHLARPDLSTLV